MACDGVWCVVYGLRWCMVLGTWAAMVYGVWYMAWNGTFGMVYGLQSIRCMVLPVIVYGVCYMGCDSICCMVYGLRWCMVYDIWPTVLVIIVTIMMWTGMQVAYMALGEREVMCLAERCTCGLSDGRWFAHEYPLLLCCRNVIHPVKYFCLNPFDSKPFEV